MTRAALASVLVTFLLGCGDASVGAEEARRGNGGAEPGSADAGGAGPAASTAPQATSPSNGKPPPSEKPDGSAPPPNANLTCTSCHGDATRVAIAGADPEVKSAPPKTATATGKAGAHQFHLNDAMSVASPIACDGCHVVPTSTSHSNGKIDIAFGPLAKTGGATPSFDGASCKSSYCHGDFDGGDKAASPTWTGGAMTCTSCHGAPPATGAHQVGSHLAAGCQACHGTGYSSTTVAKATHVNGKKNVGGAGSRINAFNAATLSCSPQCHGTRTW